MHTHTEHSPEKNAYKRCSVKGCRCSGFSSDFLCMACDLHWEEHDTIWESESERLASGLPVGKDYIPFSGMKELQEIVYGYDLVEDKVDTIISSSSSSSSPARQRKERVRPQQQQSPEELFSSGKITAQQYYELISTTSNSLPDDINDNPGSISSNSKKSNKNQIGMKFRTSSTHASGLAPKQNIRRPERSVQLSHVSSGGTKQGRVVNRYGKTD